MDVAGSGIQYMRNRCFRLASEEQLNRLQLCLIACKLSSVAILLSQRVRKDVGSLSKSSATYKAKHIENKSSLGEVYRHIG